MFDPSQQLHDYFVQQGYSDLEAHRKACRVSGRCPVSTWEQVRAHNKTHRTGVTGAEKQTMENPQVEQTSEIIDLGVDVSEADILRPVLQNGTYEAEVAFFRQEKTRVSQLDQLLIGYRLTQEAKDLNGKTVNPGFTLTQRVLLEPSGKRTQEMINDQKKRLHYAITGKLGKADTSEWQGKPVRIRVTVREPHTDDAGNSYDASNEIAGVLAPSKK